MINPEDEVIIDVSTSCTEDEAVAKMLGWMQGDRRLSFIKVTNDGIDPAQLPHLYKLPGPIIEFATDERNDARNRFLNACEKNDFESAEKWEARVEYWDKIGVQTAHYKRAIGDELCRAKSMLKLDKRMTADTGIPHITLVSLDQWVRTTYGKSIIYQEFQPELGTSPQPAKPESKARRFDALAAELDEILSKAPNPSPSKIMAELRSRVGNENTCVTRNDGDGVQWDDNYGNVKTLRLSALTERIRGWKKHRATQG